MPRLWAWDGTANVSSSWIPQQEVNEFMGMIVRWKQLVVHISRHNTMTRKDMHTLTLKMAII